MSRLSLSTIFAIAAIIIISSGAFIYFMPVEKLVPLLERTRITENERPPQEHDIPDMELSLKTLSAWDQHSPIEKETIEDTVIKTTSIYQSNNGKNEYPVKISSKTLPPETEATFPGLSFAFASPALLENTIIPESERAFKITGGTIQLAQILSTPVTKFAFLNVRKDTTVVLYATTIENDLQYILLHEINDITSYGTEEMHIIEKNFQLMMETFHILKK